MEKFKVENFLKENPGSKFPSFLELSKEDMDKIRSKFAKKIGLDGVKDNLLLVQMLYSKSESITEINAEVPSFRLADIFLKINIKPNKFVYIDWRQFDKIDSMRLDDLNEFFNVIFPRKSGHFEELVLA